jgi:hypothetical protein
VDQPETQTPGTTETNGTTATGTQTPSAAETATQQEIKGIDQNDFKDFADMTSAEQAMVKSLIAKLLGAKTFMMPASLNFYPKTLVKWSTAVKYLTYAAGTNCGSATAYPGFIACGKVATAAGLTNYASFDASHLSDLSKGNLTRLEFYDSVMKARKLPVADTLTGDDLAAACSDSSITFSALGRKTALGTLSDAEKARIANVFAAARKYGIAAKYAKDACRLHVAFTRVELVKLVTKALAAK